MNTDSGETGQAELPDTFIKRGHYAGCDGALFRLSETVCIDRTGRVGNGGWIAHDYRCNQRYRGCPARVLVTEVAVRRVAVEALASAVEARALIHSGNASRCAT